MDPVYIKTLRSRDKNIIQTYVPTVLAYLFTTYGTIAPEILMKYKLKARETAYRVMSSLSLSTTKSKN